MEKTEKKNITTFHDTIKSMEELYEKKNADYGDSITKNLKEYKQAFPSYLFRLKEKVDRCLSIYDKGNYLIDGNKYSNDELLDYYSMLLDKYPIVSIEDPVYEDDFELFAKVTRMFGDRVILVGDDLFVTNPIYLQKGIDMEAGNAILIKPNQIGTISEMIATIKLAKENNYKTIMSHRSGETEDTLIASLAVGLGTDFIKTGSMSRGERICKYNELMRIEEEIDK